MKRLNPGSQVLRVLSDCPRQQLDCQMLRFIPARTRRLFLALMRGCHVLMQDEVATYHGRATSCNWFQPRKSFCRSRVRRPELTLGGVAFYPRKVAAFILLRIDRKCPPLR